MKAGDIVAGKYTVVELLGRGGMSSIYRVRTIYSNKEAALKLLLPAKAADPNSLRRFQLEAQCLGRVTHPNVISMLDSGMGDDSNPYILMEFVDGETLESHLKRSGAMSITEFAPFFLQLCDGIAAIHAQGVIHKDIKPSNIMLPNKSVDGANSGVKIIDFGIAEMEPTSGDSLANSSVKVAAIGSPMYMSPEQCSGRQADKRTDIYALGCVLFEVLTGAPPFVADSVLLMMAQHESGEIPTLKEASLGASFSESIEHIVRTMLAKNPADRYSDISSVKRDFEAAVSGDTIQVNGIVSRNKIAPHRLSDGIRLSILQVILLTLGVSALTAIIVYFCLTV